MRAVLLSGGVGGARLARGLAAVSELDLTVVVNVGDDEEIYGLAVSPDLDTVVYTMSKREGPQGWGLAGDSFTVMESLAALGMDTTFRIGDRDLANNLYRTLALRAGTPLSSITARVAEAYGLASRILPATDDEVRTRVLIDGETWLDFQEYFVHRSHQDEVRDLVFHGSATAKPAPGVTEAIEEADLVVIGPSNPPLSIWPILAIPGITESLETTQRVAAVSPLFGGRTLKGPADRVLRSLGFSPGNLGVAEAYAALLDDLIIDQGDAADRRSLEGAGITVHLADTRIAEPEAAADFARWLVRLP